jgi:hypothetical protein
MAKAGFVPDVSLFNMALGALAPVEGEGASIDRILAIMKKYRVVPSVQTVEMLALVERQKSASERV